MKIAIYQHKGYFSDRWIQYCEANNIEYKLINPYKSDIVEQVKDCDAFMWQIGQTNYRDLEFGKSILFSLQQKGTCVFPDFNTCWHFDDKVAQKYLLESIGVPLVPSYVFYSEQEAIEWAATTEFPKVFKLKGGAGSMNVQLVHTRKEAEKLIRQCFGKGFPQYRWQDQFRENFNKYKKGKRTLRDVLRPIKYAFKKYPNELSHYLQNEIGYAYFQDFIPNNTFDIRVCVVGNKAFALKRLTRDGDFRASGSGSIVYDKQQIDERCVKIAFEVNKKLKAQSLAFDFVFDENNNPLIVEISYGYAAKAYDVCEGYWTDDMQWYKGTHFDFCGWMVENLIKQVSQNGQEQ